MLLGGSCVNFYGFDQVLCLLTLFPPIFIIIREAPGPWRPHNSRPMAPNLTLRSPDVRRWPHLPGRHPPHAHRGPHRPLLHLPRLLRLLRVPDPEESDQGDQRGAVLSDW